MATLQYTDFSEAGRAWLREWAGGDIGLLKATMWIVFDNLSPARVSREIGIPVPELERLAKSLREDIATALAMERLTVRDLLRDPRGDQAGEPVARQRRFERNWPRD